MTPEEQAREWLADIRQTGEDIRQLLEEMGIENDRADVVTANNTSTVSAQRSEQC